MTQRTPSQYEAEIAAHQDRYAVLESLYFKALDEKGEAIAKFVGADQQRQAELAEFKQWAADACDFLHEMKADAVHYPGQAIDTHVWDETYESKVIDLLRRMENP